MLSPCFPRNWSAIWAAITRPSTLLMVDRLCEVPKSIVTHMEAPFADVSLYAAVIGCKALRHTSSSQE